MLYQTKNQHGGDVYGGGITLDFSANTNPLGTPPGVLEAVCRALPRLHRYPDPYCRRLVQAIAGHEHVPASYILCGNGAAAQKGVYRRRIAGDHPRGHPPCVPPDDRHSDPHPAFELRGQAALCTVKET